MQYILKLNEYQIGYVKHALEKSAKHRIATEDYYCAGEVVDILSIIKNVTREIKEQKQ